jgi:hypothetical protein
MSNEQFKTEMAEIIKLVEAQASKPFSTASDARTSLEMIKRIAASLTALLEREPPYHAIINGDEIPFTTLVEKFDALAAVVNAHSRNLSSPEYNHFAYMQIVGMSARVIPLLLLKLAEGESQWVYALQMISGTDPVGSKDADSGHVRAAWIEWGRAYLTGESNK